VQSEKSKKKIFDHSFYVPTILKSVRLFSGRIPIYASESTDNENNRDEVHIFNLTAKPEIK